MVQISVDEWMSEVNYGDFGATTWIFDVHDIVDEQIERGDIKSYFLNWINRKHFIEWYIFQFLLIFFFYFLL